MQKQIYLQAIRPYPLATQLTSYAMDHTLQQVMAAAIHLEPRYKPRPTNNNSTTPYRPNNNTGMAASRPFVQDPTRHKCPKCNRWHAKDGKCQVTTGGNGANRGGDGDRQGNKWRNPRVSEVEAESSVNVEETE